MGPLEATIIATLLISLIAWVGIFTLFVHQSLLDQILLVLVALAAGTMLGGAFFHLLPRAITAAGGTDLLPLFGWLIVGFSLFYVLEAFIDWHHHHSSEHERDAVTYLVLAADTLHNFIDGLVIAGAFLVATPVGIVTSFAIALHEIPQEIGDFGILVYGGFGRRRALVLNYLTQSSVIVGGIVGVLLGATVLADPTVILPFAAGNFIYIASSDLIPEIKHGEPGLESALYFVVFQVGILLMVAIRFIRPLLG